MTKADTTKLSRRERQIMEIIYRLGEATAQQVQSEIADSPSYSTIRTLLAILEKKGFLKHEKKGTRYNYLPTRPRKEVGQNAISRLVRTFFDGSAEKAMAALLNAEDLQLSESDLKQMEKMIRQARREGR